MTVLQSRIVLSVQVRHTEYEHPAAQVARTLRAHADFLEKCLRDGTGPDAHGNQAIGENLVQWTATELGRSDAA